MTREEYDTLKLKATSGVKLYLELDSLDCDAEHSQGCDVHVRGVGFAREP